MPVLERLTQACLARPRLVLLAGLLVTLFFVSGIPRLNLRTDGMAIYPSDNPVVEQSEVDAETFRDPDQVIVLVNSRVAGPRVASLAGLRFLRELDRQVRRLPIADADKVRSLASLVDPDPNLSALQYAREYLEEAPTSEAEATALLERVDRHPLARGLFLSRDGSAAALYVPLARGIERRDAVSVLERWLATYSGSEFELRVTGPVVAEVLLGRLVLRDLFWMVPIMVTVMVLLLYWYMRTVAAVVAVMTEVLVVMACVLGTMGYLGIPVTLITTILPIVLMVMGAADEIHFMERLQTLHDSNPAASPEQRRAHVRAALREIGAPLVLTSLATAAGFLAYPSSTILPLRDFGVLAAMGMVLAMLSSFTLIPALVVAMPGAWWRRRQPKQAPELSPLSSFEAWICRHETASFRLGVFLIAVMLPGSFFLSIQDSWLENFDRASPVVAADEIFNSQFWGTYRFDVVLESPEPHFFRHADGLALVEEVSRLASTAPHAAGVISHLTPLGVLARMTGKSDEVSRLPGEALRTLSALSILLRSRIDLDQYQTRDAQMARVRIMVRAPDFLQGTELREHLERSLPRILEARGVKAHFSGELPIAVEVVRAIISSQLYSIVWSLIGIGLILLIGLRNLIQAVVVLVPVLAGSILVFGVLGYLGLPLGIASSMFLALSVGCGTDFALHFVHAHKEGQRAGLAHADAVRNSFASAGKAARWNAMVLGLGFLSLTLSSLRPNRVLGLLLGMAMFSAYLMTLLLLPRLLGLARRLRPNPISDQKIAVNV
ncbi:efflux RND transporter permease subunit [Pyxidicoccus sp. MSG2]|uniref:efflux RND transporter permease subunit n=1 Tax=Pyxidicoccus sp. MSG2 TaxID=2996790 RepID=UPI00226D5CB8|nr:MMPL family transporter [Pyxidicoccus sp. MSG2]MCY1021114.1 MMPL family transporter [Pyxidicoccus sp. MSG2]